MSKNMSSVPHRPMSDAEILDRLVQVKKDIDHDGRLFYRPEMNFIMDLINECEYRTIIIKAAREVLAKALEKRDGRR